jgi:2-polyprenyl-3-methyl-5-hydroxy-6-metoxy-1,4-benzoquinol methylase
MTNQIATPAPDEAKVGAFMEKTLGDAAGLFAGVLAMLGDRLGLFRALADGGPAAAGELAARAGVNERYALEWLRGMHAAGYLELGSDGRYALPPEHAPVLAAEGGPFFLGGAYELTFGYLHTIDHVIEAFRSGGGVEQSEYPHETWEGMRRFSAGFYDNLLVQAWIPTIAGLKERLEQGIRWADIGCGAGRAIIRLAEAFPASTFVGYDQFDGQLELARQGAADAGVSDRVRFELLEASHGLPEQFDVISTFDVVHDSVDPDALVRAIRQALADDGLYFLLEINCADDPAENVGPLATLMYGVSVLYCMTTSLAGGGHGLGTCGLPPAEVSKLCERGGFSSVERLPIEDPFNALYVARP